MSHIVTTIEKGEAMEGIAVAVTADGSTTTTLVTFDTDAQTKEDVINSLMRTVDFLEGSVWPPVART